MMEDKDKLRTNGTNNVGPQKRPRKRHATAPASITQQMPDDVGRIRVHEATRVATGSPPWKERRLLTDDKGHDKDGTFDIFAAAFDDLVANPDSDAPVNIDRFFGAIIDRSMRVWHEKYRGMQDELCFLKSVASKLWEHMDKFIDNFYWIQTAQLNQNRMMQEVEEQPAKVAQRFAHCAHDTRRVERRLEVPVVSDAPRRETRRRGRRASSNRKSIPAKSVKFKKARHDPCNERDQEKIVQQSEESSIAATAVGGLDASVVGAKAGNKTEDELRCELLGILQEELKRRLEPLETSLQTKLPKKPIIMQRKPLADARPKADDDMAEITDSALNTAKSAVRSFLFQALTNAVDAKTRSEARASDESPQTNEHQKNLTRRSSAFQGSPASSSGPEPSASTNSRQESIGKAADNRECFTISSDDMGIESICVDRTESREFQHHGVELSGSLRYDSDQPQESRSKCSSTNCWGKNQGERQDIDEKTNAHSSCMDPSESKQTEAHARRPGTSNTVSGKESIPEWDPIFTTPMLLTPPDSQMTMSLNASPVANAQQATNATTSTPANPGKSSTVLSVAASEGYSSLFSTDTATAKTLNTNVQNLTDDDESDVDHQDNADNAFASPAYRNAAAKSVRYIYKTNDSNWRTSHDSPSTDGEPCASVEPGFTLGLTAAENDSDSSIAKDDEMQDTDDEANDSELSENGEDESMESDPPLDEAFLALQEVLESGQEPMEGPPIAFVLFELDSAWSKEEAEKIMLAIRRFREETLLSFYPRVTHPECSDLPYLLIQKGELCSSMVGYKRDAAEAGSPTVVMSPNCLKPETATHELVHAVAFYHEEAKTDPGMDLIQIGYPEKECNNR